MSAKEMFEELGYKDTSTEYVHLIHYEKTFNDGKFLTHKIIEFDTKDEFLCVAREINGVCNYGAFYFEDGLLQAINKQVEELGWNK